MEVFDFQNGLRGSVIYRVSQDNPNHPDGYGINLGLLDVEERCLRTRKGFLELLDEPLDKFGSAQFRIPTEFIDILLRNTELDRGQATDSKVWTPHSDKGHFISVAKEAMPSRTSGGVSAFKGLLIFKKAFSLLLKEGKIKREDFKKIMDFLEEEMGEEVEDKIQRTSNVLSVMNRNLYPGVTDEMHHKRIHSFSPEESKVIIAKIREVLRAVDFVSSLNDQPGTCFAVDHQNAHFKAKQGSDEFTPDFRFLNMF